MKTTPNTSPTFTRARILQLVVGILVPLSPFISFLISRKFSWDFIIIPSFLTIASGVGLYACVKVAIATNSYERLLACMGIAVTASLLIIYGVPTLALFALGPW
jgi:hypothetical protein